MKGSPDYEAYKGRQAEISRERSAAGREIGPLPPVADPDRRNLCLDDLRLFLETYFAARFPLAWGDDQLDMIAELQRKILAGGRSARAHPRGTGKTTIAEPAVLWAIAYGHRRYVPLIGASEEKARQLLTSIKAEVETNDLLAEDFPELCYPVRCLEGINNRTAGQTLAGKRTRIEWTADRVRFPLVPGAASAWSCVEVDGIEAAIRGKAVPAPDGGKWRPDFVLIDDFQTDESARSPAQCITRERVMAGAVMGLAGPGVKIAAVALCTVIRQGDAADAILDRAAHPEWEGARSKLLRSMPADLSLWEKYGDLLRDGLRKTPPDRAAANAWYVEHRGEMDAGAVTSWPARFEPDQLSAVQFAMDLYLLDPKVFFAEYQNEPQADTPSDGAEPIDPATVVAKVNQVARGTVPVQCSRLTAFVDPNQELMCWIVAGFDERFGPAVVDYGTFPRQTSVWFNSTAPSPSLSDMFRDRGLALEARVYAGLTGAVADVLGRTYPRTGGGEPMRVELCLVDAGWGPLAGTIHQFCRESPHKASIRASRGKYVGATKAPFSQWKPGPGDRRGDGWMLKAAGAKHGREVLFDANYWKSFVAERCRSPLGTPGTLTVFGSDPAVHAPFGKHLAAEFPVRATADGRTVDEWQKKPGRPDNDWLDGLVGCCVAASVLGLSWSSSSGPPEPKKPKRKVDIEELYARSTT